LYCRDAVDGVENSSEWLTCDTVDTSSDLLLAQMLQFEMDAEHDLQLKREEDKWNGTSKGLHKFLFFYAFYCLFDFLICGYHQKQKKDMKPNRDMTRNY